MDTILLLKISFIMKDLNSNWTTLHSNTHLKSWLLKITISKLFFLKEPQTLKLKSVINKSLLQESKRVSVSSISLEDQHLYLRTTKVLWKRKTLQSIMNWIHYQHFTNQSFFSVLSSHASLYWLSSRDSDWKHLRNKNLNDSVFLYFVGYL